MEESNAEKPAAEAPAAEGTVVEKGINLPTLPVHNNMTPEQTEAVLGAVGGVLAAAAVSGSLSTRSGLRYGLNMDMAVGPDKSPEARVPVCVVVATFDEALALRKQLYADGVCVVGLEDLHPVGDLVGGTGLVTPDGQPAV